MSITDATTTVRITNGIVEFASGNPFKNETCRAAINLKKIATAEETDPKQWGWEDATWVVVQPRRVGMYLNVAIDDLLELWRVAMRD